MEAKVGIGVSVCYTDDLSMRWSKLELSNGTSNTLISPFIGQQHQIYDCITVECSSLDHDESVAR
jgi:hypothetical protein